jgi:hypothetical protein
MLKFILVTWLISVVVTVWWLTLKPVQPPKPQLPSPANTHRGVEVRNV